MQGLSYADVADQLLALEAELRRIDLWQAVPPPDEALDSVMPFAVDTLTFPQWLQFIFLVRMRALVEAGAPLPVISGIAPMAEEHFRLNPAHGAGVVRIITRIDAALAPPP